MVVDWHSLEILMDGSAIPTICTFLSLSLIVYLSLIVRSIQRILKYPPTRALSGDERQLLWKFRFSLMSEKRALTKFLRCVEWSDVQVCISILFLLFLWIPALISCMNTAPWLFLHLFCLNFSPLFPINFF